MPIVLPALIVLATLAVYLPGIHNELLFDDLLLANGHIFSHYGDPFELRQRVLSYGSFVWLQQLFGTGIWKMRAVNLALHLGVLASLWLLLRALLLRLPAAATRDAADGPVPTPAELTASRNAAIGVGIALFALNPVAVYAVGYAIQRSILMATLLSVLACWAWVRGLDTRRAAWYMGAVLAYLAAVLSKEHAVMTAALFVPLYIYVRRPPARQLALATAGASALLLVAVALLLHFYRDLLGQPFDAQSRAFVEQLEALRPGIGQHIYPLSVLNQAALFLVHGFLWVVPYVGWMSVDLRPAFPLGLASPWHIVGALVYVGLGAGAAWLLLRRRGAAALAGLLLLFPLLWFGSEFATVWVQDPFVLYRGYLWATALPGLAALALMGLRARTTYLIGAVLGIVFASLALERNLSLKNELSAWTDAAEKIDLDAPASAVGRSRPFLNLGVHHLQRNQLDQAERRLATARSLGDRGELGGSAWFNSGVILQLRQRHAEALQALRQAEAVGYSGAPLHYHRGESLLATGKAPQALQSFRIAIAKAEADPQLRSSLFTMRVRAVEAAMAARQYDVAIADLRELLQQSPTDPRLLLGLAMAQIGNGDADAALPTLDDLIARAPGAPVYHGRALALQQLGRRAEALEAADQATRLDPRNPQYASLRAALAGTRP